jgi:hypothetical protein
MPAESPPSAPPSLPKYLAEGLPKQDVEALSDAREFIDGLIEWSQRPVEEDDLPDSAESVDGESDERTGTVVMEKVTCGDESCKCMTGDEKHGPYKYRYYRTDDGTLTSEYIDNE